MRFLFERTQDGWHCLSSVIAGLDPAIHLSSQECLLRKRMDPRVKPAGDAGERVSAQPNDRERASVSLEQARQPYGDDRTFAVANALETALDGGPHFAGIGHVLPIGAG